MVIKDIRTHLLSVPYVDPPQTGFLTLESLDLLIVEIEMADGLVGVGHLHPIAGGMRTLEMCIHEMLKPHLVGQHFEDPAEVWQRLWLATLIQGRMGITMMAMSAIDIALWDAVGIAAGQPLWALWGGRGDPLKAYGSGCFRGLGHDGMIDKAQAFVAAGFNAIKMQVAHVFTHEEDVANVRDMRAALGDDIDIMVDVNQGWTVEESIAVGKRLDAYHPAWLEEPVLADDNAGYLAIAAAIDTPVVGGENHFTWRDMLPLIDSGKVPVLQPDIMRGGYTDMLATASRAAARDVTIAPHLFPEMTTHVLAAIPNAAWLEYMGWYDHLWVEPVAVVDGFMTPPDRPGHGMQFRPELFSEFPYRD
ncbi:MAG: mandelate racemase/muconate lactonizing enzyme family protein [Pseudomonadota bacterium]